MWFLGQLIYDGFYDGFSFVQLFCHLASSKLLESFETSMARRGSEGKKKTQKRVTRAFTAIFSRLGT